MARVGQSSAVRVRTDVQGELWRTGEGPGARYFARQSLDVAWHLLDPEDLAFLLPGEVVRVAVDHRARAVDVHYPPGRQPLDLEALQAAVARGRPFWPWRLAVLGKGLVASALALHEADLPQGVVHPERVAYGPGGFGLLPVLAGTLPPLCNVTPNTAAGWLHFVAPEVLRTRMNRAELLAAGDVYALGRILLASAAGDFRPDTATAPLGLMDRLVEGRAVLDLGLAADSEASALALRMCARLPEDRPSLAEALSELDAIAARWHPAARIRAALAAGQLDPASSDVGDLGLAPPHPAFDLGPLERFLLEAEIALAKRDVTRAIDRLGRALHVDETRGDLHARLAAVYRTHTAHPQHLLLSAASYAHAALASDFAPDVVDAWAEVLLEIGDAREARAALTALPWDRRTPRVHATRLRAVAAEGGAEGGAEIAWQEALAWVRAGPFDPLMAEVLRELASELEPGWLMAWMALGCDGSVPDAMMAAICERVGDSAGAADAQARAARGRRAV